MISRICCASIILSAVFLTGCDALPLDSVRDDFHKSFTVDPGGTLILDSDRGSIEVSSGGRDQVRVDIEREVRGSTNDDVKRVLNELNLTCRQEGNNVYVTSRYPGSNFGFSWNNRLRLRFVILVPDKFNVDLKTGGGGINVNDLQGTVQARTSGGSLHFGHINGSVDGRTSGGSINLEGGSGQVDVETSGGSIRVGKAEGPINAHTSGGGIVVEEVRGRIRASTSGGSVEATITNQPEGDCELSTSGGSIRARLNKDLNLDLEAKTSGGAVHNSIPVRTHGDVSRNRLEATMNQGGPRLKLNTSGGSITISEAK
jgi:hypothetical protein